MLKLIPENPSPFVWPLLVLRFEDGDEWYVDVGGKVDLYVHTAKFDPLEAQGMLEAGHMGNELRQASKPLLREFARGLFAQGKKIQAVGICKKDTGPSHILRHGAIFARVNRLEEDPKKQLEESWMREEPKVESSEGQELNADDPDPNRRPAPWNELGVGRIAS